MSSPVSLLGAGNQSTSASSSTSPVLGCLIFRNAAKRGLGRGAAIRSTASPAAGPEMRMTATPARPWPLERAKMVGCSAIGTLWLASCWAYSAAAARRPAAPLERLSP